MCCDSAIYTANTSSVSIGSGNTIPLGSVVNKAGRELVLNGDSIRTCGTGYYVVNASFNVVHSAVGNVSVTMLVNGVAVPGSIAVGSVSTVGNSVNLTINSMIRQSCCMGNSDIRFVIGGQTATVTNASVVAEKVG